MAGAVDKLRTLVGLKPDRGLAQRNQRTFTSLPPSFDRGPPLTDRPAGFRVAPENPVGQASGASLPDWMPAAEEPFLSMTFGTVAGRSERVRNAHRVLLAAVGSLPVKALLTTGPVIPRDELGGIPDNVRVEKFVPQVTSGNAARADPCRVDPSEPMQLWRNSIGSSTRPTARVLQAAHRSPTSATRSRRSGMLVKAREPMPRAVHAIAEVTALGAPSWAMIGLASVRSKPRTR